MVVESASWDDWSASNAPPINDDEKWHVALAPGEVKIVSLEQLDDLFRLSIVDSETKVWQDGMTEWQPLGVIAGIDDKPAPEPKRTHPKPPSPRSSPPPAPRRSVPSPPRPASHAPVAAASFYPQAATSASFYPEPIAVAPIRTVTPLTSVRPLVVSQQPRAASGGGFGRFLLGLAAVAGVSVTLYRNDVVRDAAHSLHQDALYARLQEALGGPSFGTLASLEQGSSAITVSSLSAALAAAPATTNEPSPAAASIRESNPTPALSNTGSAPPVVSLESLKPETASAAKVAVAASSPAPSAVAKSAAQPKPQGQAAAPAPAFKAAVAKAEPVAKAAPVEKATPPKVEKATPPKNEADMTPRERLNAAIAASMMSSPPPSKKGSRSKASEYDPLNPKL